MTEFIIVHFKKINIDDCQRNGAGGFYPTVPQRLQMGFKSPSVIKAGQGIGLGKLLQPFIGFLQLKLCDQR